MAMTGVADLLVLARIEQGIVDYYIYYWYYCYFYYF
jgi:hypothetical protein